MISNFKDLGSSSSKQTQVDESELTISDACVQNTKNILKQQNIKQLTKLFIYNIQRIPQIDKILNVKYEFINLQVLSLDNNKITTIEHLSSVYFPVLRKLLLYSNNIVFIKSLRKMNFPNLCQLSLSMNNISQINCLSQMETPNLEELRIYSNKELNINESVFKYNFPILTQLVIQETIVSQEKNICLKRKFPRLR